MLHSSALEAMPAGRSLLLIPSSLPRGAVHDIEQGVAPRVDYLELADRLGADVIDTSVYEMRPWRWLLPLDRRMRLAWGQAWAAIRQWKGYDTVYSFSEDVGIPFSHLLKAFGYRARHIVIAHNVCSKRKVPLVRLLGSLRGIDTIVTVSRSEATAIRALYGVAVDRLMYTPNYVDERFWSLPPQAIDSDPRLVVSLGRAKRDYKTLLAAAAGQDATLHLQASSKWHPNEGHLGLTSTAHNIQLGGYLDYPALRALVARCAVVAVALNKDAHGSAGTTSLLEGMAMAKPVVVATDHSLAGYVSTGETGLIVPSGDEAAMRSAIMTLLDDPNRAVQMGRRGRELVERDFRLDDVVSALATLATRCRSDTHCAR